MAFGEITIAEETIAVAVAEAKPAAEAEAKPAAEVEADAGSGAPACKRERRCLTPAFRCAAVVICG